MSLKELKEPMLCPACTNAQVPRIGFLRRVTGLEEASSIINAKVDYVCQTCFAEFEVESDL